MSTRLQARLLLAELEHTPWPPDAFDPKGRPLRRIERDGRLMAAYSVGEDGVDDGGDPKKDVVWELYGTLTPLVPPKPSAGTVIRSP